MLDSTESFLALRRHADIQVATAIEHLIRSAPDSHLNRINPLAFAKEYGLEEGTSIAGFLHATRIGLFELSWNVVCGGCGGILHSGDSLKAINRGRYSCALCAADCEPNLDERVEVTFTVDPRVRRIAAHNPDALPLWDYARQIYWSSGSDLASGIGPIISEAVVDAVELAAGQHAPRTIQVSKGLIVVFDPVTHTSRFLEIAGTPTGEMRNLRIAIDEGHMQSSTSTLAPGPLCLSLENATTHRTLPIIWMAGDALRDLVGRRIPVLTANRLLTHQTFRDLYRTDVLDIDQRFKITNLTFLFTDLRGSTELYEHIGDLAAFDLVREHFHALTEIVVGESGAVVKTIGDAVMATFLNPARGVAAALRMRAAMKALSDRHGHQEMLLKIGLHAGPCLAVVLNERQDYFGQAVNIAARVQGIAKADSILLTEAVAEDAQASALIQDQGVTMSHVKGALRGISQEISIYEIS